MCSSEDGNYGSNEDHSERAQDHSTSPEIPKPSDLPYSLVRALINPPDWSNLSSNLVK